MEVVWVDYRVKQTEWLDAHRARIGEKGENMPSLPLSRRDFLQVSTVAAAELQVAARTSMGRAAPEMAAERIVEAVNPVFDRPLRWGQLVMVENDPGRFDPKFWVDYFKRTHCQGVCLNAGGIVAFYPTRIPLHHRSAWLRDLDPFGELVAGCKQAGMAILARTDPHAVRKNVVDAHPDWIAVQADGNKRRHWARPDLWVTCALGPYNFEFMTRVHREIVTLYPVDGIFINRWAGHGICYCEHCRKNFKEASGFELPRGDNPDPAVGDAYTDWRIERLVELWRVWDQAMREIRPGSRCVPNGPPDLKSAAELADIMFQDRQARRGLACPWLNGRFAKELRATMGRKPIGGIFSVGFEEPYRWKDSVQAEPEVRIWACEAIANGMRPWFTKFSGTLYDKRWLPVVERIYDWHHRAEPYLRNEYPLARVGLVYSEQSERFYDRGERRQNVEEHLKGAYHALVEARIPFEMVHESFLQPERLAPFKLLILPNIAALSERQCAQLTDFVKQGGSLLATFETSLYNESGEHRKEFGLSDLFGVSFRELAPGPMHNSYLSIDPDSTGAFHPVLKGLEDATRIINGTWRLDVTPRTQDSPSPLTLIPPYPDLPMEDVYPRVPKTDIRELYLREVEGGGRVAYFPWDITRVFWEVLDADHGLLFANTVRWALNEPPLVSVKGPGVLDIALWRQKQSITLHLVNLTNPMMMKGPIRELLPVGPQTVRLRLPEGVEAKKVQLLRAGKTPEVRQTAEGLSLVIPEILDHEIVAIDT